MRNPAPLRRQTLRILRRVEEATTPQLSQDAVLRVLARLTPREREIIRLRFGIGGPSSPAALSGAERTFPLHLRRLEASALRKLRADALGPSDDDTRRPDHPQRPKLRQLAS